MIFRLGLTSFKCFKQQDFDLCAINIFTGYNGRGKSTVFQALLMLAQSIIRHGDLQTLEVNGCFVRQDLYDDVLCCESKGQNLVFEIAGKTQQEAHELKVSFTKKSSTTGQLIGLIYNNKDYFEEGADLNAVNTGKLPPNQGFLFNYPRDCNALFSDFSYLSANRIGPTLFEVKNDLESVNPLGTEGQFRLNFLKNNDTFKDELNHVIDYILDGGNIVMNGEEDESPVLSFGFKRIGKNDTEFKAINCGFGYGYILSILLQALNSKGGCLFLENPEAHLHPCAQSRLMKVLCQICLRTHTQLFIETHSEHILNAIRLMVVKKESDISEKDVSVYFFAKDFSVFPLELDSKGQIHPWPKGFFDQQEEDLSSILSLGIFREE